MGLFDRLKFWKREEPIIGPDLGPELGLRDEAGLGMRPQPDFGLQQKYGYQAQQPMPQPESLSSQQTYNLSKNMEVLSAKMDAIRALLDNISQRLNNIEDALYQRRRYM